MSSSRMMISVGLGGAFLAASKEIELGGVCQEESQGIELEVAF